VRLQDLRSVRSEFTLISPSSSSPAETDAKKRLAVQMPTTERLTFASVAIDTSGPKETTRAALRREWDALMDRLSAAGK
jgi:dephospho-CoA kinase